MPDQGHDQNSVNTDAIDELRRIIVQPDEVGEVLPEALSRRAEKDAALAEATLPIVEENIRISAQRNPKILAEAIFPIIGPAIRKAISEALAQMIQSLNQTLERSFSPQGIKWRLEAMQTGKPFAEVVLLHSLLFRVEQVFLIHKETGLLLQHVSSGASEHQDGEMVSAMLTAIQDFVRDSFETSEDATLDSLKVRDFSIWIENSPDAILAAVIRGNAPLTLRQVFLEAIERIQAQEEEDFGRFKGDASMFDDTRPVLEDCLRMQLEDQAPAAKKILTPFNLMAAAVFCVAMIAGFFYVRDYLRWSDFLARLRSEPGIVVTESERGLFKHEIAGLRDELAADPAAIAAAAGYDQDDITQVWRPFQDLSDAIVVKRAAGVLAAPADVKLSFSNGVLTADGAVTRQWFARASEIAPALSAVREFRLGFVGLKSIITARRFEFSCGTTDLTAAAASQAANASRELELLIDAAADRPLRIIVEGMADSTGAAEANLEISRARAGRLLEELLARSPKLIENRAKFSTVGVGTSGADSECRAAIRIESD